MKTTIFEHKQSHSLSLSLSLFHSLCLPVCPSFPPSDSHGAGGLEIEEVGRLPVHVGEVALLLGGAAVEPRHALHLHRGGRGAESDTWMDIGGNRHFYSSRTIGSPEG